MIKNKKSAFDRIKHHLNTRGETTRVAGELSNDLDAVVRRCDDVRGLGREYGAVELSPYMLSLLNVSRAIPREQTSVRAAAVAMARG